MIVDLSLGKIPIPYKRCLIITVKFLLEIGLTVNSLLFTALNETKFIFLFRI